MKTMAKNMGDPDRVFVPKITHDDVEYTIREIKQEAEAASTPKPNKPNKKGPSGGGGGGPRGGGPSGGNGGGPRGGDNGGGNNGGGNGGGGGRTPKKPKIPDFIRKGISALPPLSLPLLLLPLAFPYLHSPLSLPLSFSCFPTQHYNITNQANYQPLNHSVRGKEEGATGEPDLNTPIMEMVFQ